MTRDYSQLFPGSTPTTPPNPLRALGWQSFFASQLDADEMTKTPPVRVTEVHRSGLRARGAAGDVQLPPDADVTVGDWLLYDAETPGRSRRLERKSLIQRRAPGRETRMQLIAANLDTVFITTSCNADFNVARLERYVALAFEAEVTPVIVLTKADLEDPAPYVEQAEAISARVPVIALDARADNVQAALAPWAKPGQTVGFLGSSGVGKTTLTNALAGTEAATQDIREDDAKGRHTTRHRELYITGTGPVVLDTPGMRELQLADVSAGLSTLFADIEELATTCKFRDCAHETEPGCAVRAAIEAGDLDPERLMRWRKLAAEEELNAATVHEKRDKARATAKMYRRVQSEKKNRR
jgi:ribosome biogenesis GTPase